MPYERLVDSSCARAAGAYGVVLGSSAKATASRRHERPRSPRAPSAPNTQPPVQPGSAANIATAVAPSRPQPTHLSQSSARERQQFEHLWRATNIVGALQPPRAEDGGEATVHRVAYRGRVLDRPRLDVLPSSTRCFQPHELLPVPFDECFPHRRSRLHIVREPELCSAPSPSSHGIRTARHQPRRCFHYCA